MSRTYNGVNRRERPTPPRARSAAESIPRAGGRRVGAGACGCTIPLPRDNFRPMSARTVQLVLHYDGADFAGWQRQKDARTVQGAVEGVLERLCGAPVPVVGAGRTDAGVHARGQAAGVSVPEKWDAAR